MKCEHCGAMLAPSAMECSYCRAPTAAGRAASQAARERAEYDDRARAQWAAQREHEARTLGFVQLMRASRNALWWSIGGLACCLPLALVGFVQSLRARSLAKSLRAPLPSSGWIGLGLGGTNTLFTLGFYIWAGVHSSQQDAAAAARIKVLETQTQTSAAAVSLSQPTACALAEAFALKNKYESDRGPELHDFECLGRLNIAGDLADLDAFRFGGASDRRYEAHACFKHGARWYVTATQAGACAGMDGTSSAATPSGAASSVPVPAKRR